MLRFTEEFAAAAAANNANTLSKLFTGVGASAKAKAKAKANPSSDDNINTHAQAMIMLSQIKDRYAEGQEILSILSRNVDFAQIQLQCSLYSGSGQGYFRALVKDILTQAPLHVKLYLGRQLTSNVVSQSATCVCLLVGFRTHYHNNQWCVYVGLSELTNI